MFDFFTFTYNDYVFHGDYLLLGLLSFILLIISQVQYLSYDSLSKRTKIFSNIVRYLSIFSLVGIPLQFLYVLIKNTGRKIQFILSILFIDLFFLFSLFGVLTFYTFYSIKDNIGSESIIQEKNEMLRDVTLSASIKLDKSTEIALGKYTEREIIKMLNTQSFYYQLKPYVYRYGSFLGLFSSDISSKSKLNLLQSDYDEGMKSNTNYITTIQNLISENKTVKIIDNFGSSEIKDVQKLLFKVNSSIFAIISNKNTQTLDIVDITNKKTLIKDIAFYGSQKQRTLHFIIYKEKLLFVVTMSSQTHKYFEINNGEFNEIYLPSLERELFSVSNYENLQLNRIFLGQYNLDSSKIKKGEGVGVYSRKILKLLSQNGISLFFEDDNLKDDDIVRLVNE